MMNNEVATVTTPVNLEHITSLAEAWQVCQMLSQSTLVPDSLKNKPANVLLVYMTGRELGLTFAQSLRTVYIASGGQPQLRGVLLLALIRRAGHDYWFEQGDDYCTTFVKRGDTGKEYKATFTLEDAEAAELVKRAPNGDLVAYSGNNRRLPWMTYQRNMLRWRSVAEAANMAAPEVMMGFDLMDYASPQEQPDLKPAARPAADEGPQPGSGMTGEAAAAELTGLDARGAAASPGEAPAAEATSTASPPARPEPPGPDDPRSASPASTSAQRGNAGDGNRKASARELQRLGEKFGDFGWTWGENRNDIAQALTTRTRRVITKPGDLSGKEASAISIELGEILRKEEDADRRLIVLSDTQDGWEADWAREDPEGYERDYVAAHSH